MHGPRRCCRDTPWNPAALRNRAALVGPGPAFLRCALLLRLEDRDSASLLCLFAGPIPSAAHSLRRLGTGPSFPWLGRSPGPASTGRSPDSGSPPGALANLRLTHGEPVRPGKVPPALFLPRPHPCRLGAGIPAGDGLRNKCSIDTSGYCGSLWDISEFMPVFLY